MSAAQVTVPGIPETITRERYRALVEGAGFDVNELVSLRFEVNGIYAEVYATDENGRRFTADGKTVATHNVCIKVIDKETP